MRSARILIVDDEPGLLRAAERILASEHEVASVSSSRGAIALAAGFNPDVAILDIRMPDVDGFELMARLKENHPGLDFILMTGAEPDLALVRALGEHAFFFIQKPFDRMVFKRLVELCLTQRHLADENRSALRLRREIEEARAIQQGLLPAAEAVVEGVALCCRYVPSSELGGDFYDYVHAGDGRVGLLIADASGHGMSAAMLTLIVKTAFHEAHVDGYAPLTVVSRIARNLAPFNDSRAITVFSALIDMHEGRIDYVNAGHPAPLLWGSDWPPRRLDSTGLILSPALPPGRWKPASLSFQPGSRLFLYTDGVTEAPAPDGEFGEERLYDTLAGAHAGGAALLDSILASVRGQAGATSLPDDVAMVVARLG